MKKLNLTQKVINEIKKGIFKLEVKNNTMKIYMCHSNRRFEYRKKENKIPQDQPQCPVFKDDRCCGSCYLGNTCEYAVDCNCSGYCYGQLGGTDESYYMRKEGNQQGRIKDGKFDWDYYRYIKYAKHKKYVGIDVFYSKQFFNQKLNNDEDKLKELLKKTNGFDLNKIGITQSSIVHYSEIPNYVEIISVNEDTMEIVVSTKSLGGDFEGVIPNCLLNFYNSKDTLKN